MVLHVVLFRPKNDISDADRRAIFRALHVAASEIPSVRRFYVGKRLTHGSGYERLMNPNVPYAPIVGFETPTDT